MAKKTESDFFIEASGLFLTKQLTDDEFDEILDKGQVLPVCEAYEDWDTDFLERSINQTASALFTAYQEGIDSISDQL